MESKSQNQDIDQEASTSEDSGETCPRLSRRRELSFRNVSRLERIPEDSIEEQTLDGSERVSSTPPSKLRLKLKKAEEMSQYFSHELEELAEFNTFERQCIAAEEMCKSELNLENNRLKSELDAKQQILESKESLLSTLEERLEALNDDYKSLMDTNKTLSKERDSYKNKFIEEEIKRETSQKKWLDREEELKKSLEEAWGKLSKKEEQFISLNELCMRDGFQTNLEDVHAEFSSCKSIFDEKIEDINTTCRRISSSIESDKLQKDEKSHESEEFDQDFKMLVAQLESTLKEKSIEFATFNDNFKQKIAEKDMLIRQLQEKLYCAIHLNKSIHKEDNVDAITNLKFQVDQQMEEIENCKVLIAEKGNDYELSESKIKSELIEVISKHETKIQELNVEIAKLNNELSDKNMELTESKNNEDVNLEIGNIKTTIDTFNSNITLMDSAMSGKIDNVLKTVDRAEARISSISTTLKANEFHPELFQSNSNLNTLLGEEIGILRDEIVSLKSLGSKSEIVEAFKIEISKLDSFINKIYSVINFKLKEKINCISQLDKCFVSLKNSLEKTLTKNLFLETQVNEQEKKIETLTKNLNAMANLVENNNLEIEKQERVQKEHVERITNLLLSQEINLQEKKHLINTLQQMESNMSININCLAAERDKVEALEKKLELLEKEKNSLEAKNLEDIKKLDVIKSKSLEEDFSHDKVYYENQLIESGEEILALQEVICELKGKILSLDALNASFGAQLQKLGDALSEKDNEIEKMSANLEEKIETVVILEKKLELTISEKAALKTKNIEIIEKLDAIKSVEGDFAHDKEYFENKLMQNDKETQALKEAKQVAETQVCELTEKIVSLDALNASLGAQLQKLADSLAGNDNEMEKMSANLEEKSELAVDLEKELDLAISRNAALETKNLEMAEKLDEMKSVIRDFAHDKEYYEKELMQNGKDILILKEAKQVLESQVSEFTKKLADLEKELEILETNKNVEITNVSVNEEIQNNRDALAEKDNEIERLSASLETKNLEIAEKQDEIKSVKEDLAHDKEYFENKLMQNIVEIMALKEAKQDLETQVCELSEKIVSLEALNASFGAQLQKLADELAEKDNEMEKMCANLEEKIEIAVDLEKDLELAISRNAALETKNLEIIEKLDAIKSVEDFVRDKEYYENELMQNSKETLTLKEAKQDLETQVCELSEKIVSLDALNASFGAQLQKLGDEVAEKDSEIEKISAKLEEKSELAVDLEKELDLAISEKATLKTKNIEIIAKLDALQSVEKYFSHDKEYYENELMENGKKILALSEAKQGLETQVCELMNKLEDLEKELETLETTKNAEITNLSFDEDLRKLGDALAAKDAEVESVSAVLEEKIENVKFLEKELEENMVYSKKLEENLKRFESLEHELHQLKETKTVIEARHEEFIKQIEILNLENDNYEHELNVLKDQNTSLKKEIEAFEAFKVGKEKEINDMLQLNTESKDETARLENEMVKLLDMVSKKEMDLSNEQRKCKDLEASLNDHVSQIEENCRLQIQDATDELNLLKENNAILNNGINEKDKILNECVNTLISLNSSFVPFKSNFELKTEKISNRISGFVQILFKVTHRLETLKKTLKGNCSTLNIEIESDNPIDYVLALLEYQNSKNCEINTRTSEINQLRNTSSEYCKSIYELQHTLTNVESDLTNQLKTKFDTLSQLEDNVKSLRDTLKESKTKECNQNIIIEKLKSSNSELESLCSVLKNKSKALSQVLEEKIMYIDSLKHKTHNESLMPLDETIVDEKSYYIFKSETTMSVDPLQSINESDSSAEFGTPSVLEIDERATSLTPSQRELNISVEMIKQDLLHITNIIQKSSHSVLGDIVDNYLYSDVSQELVDVIKTLLNEHKGLKEELLSSKMLNNELNTIKKMFNDIQQKYLEQHKCFIKLKKTQEDVKALKQELMIIKNNCNELKEPVNEMMSSVSNYVKNIITEEETNTQLHNDILELRAKLNQNEKIISDLNESKKSQDQELKELMTERDSHILKCEEAMKILRNQEELDKEILELRQFVQDISNVFNVDDFHDTEQLKTEIINNVKNHNELFIKNGDLVKTQNEILKDLNMIKNELLVTKTENDNIVKLINDFELHGTSEDILKNLKLIFVENSNKVNELLKLLNISNDGNPWELIIKKVVNDSEINLKERIRNLELDLMDADSFKRSFANEVHAMMPDKSVYDLMALPFADLHTTMITIIMEKEHHIIQELQTTFDKELKVKNDKIDELEDENQRRLILVKEIMNDNENLNNECKTFKELNEKLTKEIQDKINDIKNSESYFKKEIEKRQTQEKSCICDQYKELNMKLSNETDKSKNLEIEIQNCYSEIEALKSSLERMSITNEDNNNKLKSTLIELGDFKTKYNQLLCSSDKYQNYISEMEAKLVSISNVKGNEVQLKHDEIEKMMHEKEALESELSRFNFEYKNLFDESNKLKSTLNELQLKFQSLCVENDNLVLKVVENQKANVELSNQIKMKEEFEMMLKSDLANKNKIKEELEEEIKNVRQVRYAHIDASCPHLKRSNRMEKEMLEVKKLKCDYDMLVILKKNLEGDLRCKAEVILELEGKLAEEMAKHKQMLANRAEQYNMIENQCVEQASKIKRLEEMNTAQRDTYVKEKIIWEQVKIASNKTISDLQTKVHNYEKFCTAVLSLIDPRPKSFEEGLAELKARLNLLNTLKKDVDTYLNKISDLTDELNERHEQYKHLDEECDVLNNEITAREKMLDDDFVKIEELEKNIETEVAKNQALIIENATLLQNIDLLNTKISSLDAEINARGGKITELSKKANKLEEVVLKSKAFEKEVVALRQKLQLLETESEAIKADIKCKIEHSENLSRKLKEEISKTETAILQRNHLDSEVVELKQKNSSYQKALQDSEKRIKELQNEKMKALTEGNKHPLRQLNNTDNVNDNDKILQKLSADLARKDVKINELETANAKIMAEYEMVKMAFHRQEKQNGPDINTKAMIQELQERITKLEKDRAVLKKLCQYRNSKIKDYEELLKNNNISFASGSSSS